MKTRVLLLVTFLALATFGMPAPGADRSPGGHAVSFDSDWRFLRADATGADAPGFDDKAWRVLDLPHDWSIEDLPSTNSAPPSPFNPALSAGGAATGYVVGGIGWYRKHFKLPAADAGKNVAICFDGVYMNSDVWLNGQHLGNHPYGYTPFVLDFTPYLKPAGQENVLAVQVKNVGKNSRWYGGSGIYRHVWLAVADPAHIPFWGVHVVTTNVSKAAATVSVSTTVENDRNSDAAIRLRTRLVSPDGKAGKPLELEVRIPAGRQLELTQDFLVSKPVLWSPNNPALYRADVELVDKQNILDHSDTTFGIRTLRITATNGFELNGEVVKLKGGCMHHDNGPLGSAAIDRAEERRVGLLKANGYNAIRTSHNPPSPAFLDACDRFGMLVVDEAFDCWDRAKNPQDYHLYFKDWSDRDIASMVCRDRNHPSVVIWSIGNEIPEQFGTNGTAKRLREAVLAHDSTRPITQAICNDWGQVTRNWDTLSDPAFVNLDVAGYNYLPNKYESDRARHPERVIMGTESYPKDFFDYWSLVEKHPYVIGDFTWTAMDYLGESGIGHSLTGSGRDPFFMSWPWFNAWCGDIDICGFKKPQSFYRDVVWDRSQIEMAVHAPIPEGQREHVSGWGWPDETQSWNWPGQGGKPLQVAVYSRCDTVRLELNGKVIGEKPVSARTKLTVKFDVPYAPGELRAIGLVQGKAVARTTLKTSGSPRKLKLIADREKIRADRNDLSYVTVEVVDAFGQRVPNGEFPVRFSVTGAGELAAQGSGSPNTPASFHAPSCRTFEGRCLAILRPNGSRGKIELRADADGLESSQITVITR